VAEVRIVQTRGLRTKIEGPTHFRFHFTSISAITHPLFLQLILKVYHKPFICDKINSLWFPGSYATAVIFWLSLIFLLALDLYLFIGSSVIVAKTKKLFDKVFIPCSLFGIISFTIEFSM